MRLFGLGKKKVFSPPKGKMMLKQLFRNRRFSFFGVGILSFVLLLAWGILLYFTPASLEVLPPAEAVVEDASTTKDADLIRVGISDDAMTEQSLASVIISADVPFTLHTAEKAPILKSFQAGDALQLTPHHHTMKISVRTNGGTTFYPLTLASVRETLWLKPLDSVCCLKLLNITRKGKTPQYRGAIQVVADAQSKRLVVINQLPLQDYLRAVVPNELPIRFGIEAVKAQAVAARNYALRPREKNWHRFDICDSQLCQAYYGRQTETPETDAMLEQTEGQVLLYQGQIALALYSSSHGGVSTNYHNAFSHPATQAFPAPPLPYLQSVWDKASVQAQFEDLSNEATLLEYLKETDLPSYDRKSPHYRWQERLSYLQLTENIQRNLPQLLARSSNARWIEQSPDFKSNGIVNRLEPLQRDNSGKLISLKIHTTQGFLVVQKEFVIRSLLRSPNRFFLSATIAFEPYVDGVGKEMGVTIYGTGFGHGVGMSQFGASGMNEAGFLYPAILTHYYPYTTLGSPPLTLNPLYAQRQKLHGVQGTQAILNLEVPKGKKLEKPFIFKINEVSLRVHPFFASKRIFNITPYLNQDGLNHVHWSTYEVPLKAWISFEAHSPSS